MEKAYDNLIIYYFSGTGNSLTAANWIAENAKNRGMETHVIPIVNTGDFDHSKLIGKTLTGFAYATHGFCAPWAMLKFFWKFPKGYKTKVFFLNTRGGWRFFKWAGPGLSGTALLLPMLMLFLKGYTSKGLMSLDMPHSWVSFFPPNFKSWEPTIVNYCKRICTKFSNSILDGHLYITKNVWFEMPIGILLFPVTIVYVFFARFFLAKTLYASSVCNHCRICETNCPVQAIEFIDNRPFWKVTCESCMRCMNICPLKAIQSWVTRMFLFFWAVTVLGTSLLGLNANLVFWVISPILLFPIYWLLFKLFKYKLFNQVFEYTSFTRLWGRYFASGIKLKDLKNEKHQVKQKEIS